MLLFEHVDVIGEDVGKLQGVRIYLHEQVDTLLVRVGSLLVVVHVGVDITHGVVGHTHAVAVVAHLGVLVHGVYLLHTRVGLSCEVEGFHEYGPGLVVVLPVLCGRQELEGRGHLLVDGVVEVVVVEKYDLQHPGIGFLMRGVLLLAFVDELVDAAQLVVEVVKLETKIVEILQDGDAFRAFGLGQFFTQILRLVGKERDRGEDAHEQYRQPAVEVHISTHLF